MAIDVVVVGAGGFGRETLDVIEALNGASADPPLKVVGIVDDRPAAPNLERIAVRGYAYLGTIEAVLAIRPCNNYMLGVGNPKAKASIAEQFDRAGWLAVGAIHPGSIVGSQARIGDGSVICAGVQLSTNTTLGRHVHLNPNATVGHDSTLGDYVSVNPGAIVSGEVTIGPRTLVGAGAVVLQGLSVGGDATIGACACVTRAVEPATTLVGIPARPLKERPTP